VLSPIMLALLLAGTGLHAPSGSPCFRTVASSQIVVCRTRALVAQISAAEAEAAKAAWLEKAAQPEPSWKVGRAISTGTSPVAPVSEMVDAKYLIPGSPILTLEAADEMANVAVREASTRSFNPISVVVVDVSGRTIVAKTMIGASGLTGDFALAKANVCIGMHCSSREFRDKYQNGDGIGPKMPQLLGMGTAAAAANRPLAAFPGGVMCRDAAGNLVGAIGVSGAASDEDEHCAISGAQAVGLVTDPAASQLK